jgi:hypothetical protein
MVVAYIWKLQIFIDMVVTQMLHASIYNILIAITIIL